MWIAASIPFWILGAILAFIGAAGIPMVIRDMKSGKATDLNIANFSVAVVMLLTAQILFAAAIKIAS